MCGRWAERWNGRIWFIASQQYYGGSELWSTDGTAAGTRVEVALDDSIRNTRICDLTVTSNGLVFAATPLGVPELWRTDGTAGGTMRLGTIAPVEPSVYSVGGWFKSVNGMAYFMADESPGSGRELWRTDGTASGTTLVTDLTPGTVGARAFGITQFGQGVMLAYESMDDDTVRPVPGFGSVGRRDAGKEGHRHACPAAIHRKQDVLRAARCRHRIAMGDRWHCGPNAFGDHGRPGREPADHRLRARRRIVVLLRRADSQ